MLESQNGRRLSLQRTSIIIFTLLGLYPLLGMGIDLIVPSLPMIAQFFHTSNAFSKNLITIFLLGMITGNFVVGLLADSNGRRLIILTGLLFFALASLLPVFFPHKFILLISRFLQGMTLATYSTTARAIMSDILPDKQLMKTATLTATMWGIGPIVGPIIGSYLQFYFNWQACFYFYAIFTFIGFFILLLTLPETHFNRHPLNIKHLKKNYIEIFSNRIFISLSVLMGLNYSLLIVFNTLSSFLIQNQLGFSLLVFGRIALVCGIVFVLSTVLYKQILKFYTPYKAIEKIVPVGFLLALVALILAYFNSKNIFMVVGPTLAMFMICGILYPASMSAGVVIFRHLAATASSIMSLINILITCTTAFIMSFIEANSAIPMIFTYLVIMFICILIYFFMTQTKQ